MPSSRNSQETNVEEIGRMMSVSDRGPGSVRAFMLEEGVRILWV